MMIKILASAFLFTCIISWQTPPLFGASSSWAADLLVASSGSQTDSSHYTVSSEEPALTTSITVEPPQASEVDKERERLELLLRQLSAKEQELALLREKTLAATNRMHVEKTRAETLEAQLTQKEQELAGLCNQRNTYQEMSQELNRTKSSLEQSRQQVGDIERQFAISNEQLDQSLQRIAELDQRLSAREQELKLAKSSLTDVEQQLAAQTTQLTQATRMLENLGRSLPKPTMQDPSGKGRPATPGSISAKLTKTLQEELKRGAVVLRQDGEKITLALSSGELFGQGRVTMTAAGTSLVRRIGAALNKFRPQSIEVAGHTDNIPVRVDNRRPFRNNEELSQARADHAGQALIKSGLGSDRVKTIGYADTQPIATNDTEAGRSKNRRVEIIVTQGPDSVASSNGKDEPVANTAKSPAQHKSVVQKVVNR